MYSHNGSSIGIKNMSRGKSLYKWQFVFINSIVIVVSNSVNIEIINQAKTPWLAVPTQLFIQGQWWSNLSTHRLQIEQWRDRSVLTTSQSGHNRTGSNYSSSCMNVTPVGFLRKPGSLHITIICIINVMTNILRQ